MPDVRVHAADSFGAQAGRRWQVIDSLLPVPGNPAGWMWRMYNGGWAGGAAGSDSDVSPFAGGA